MLFRSPSSRPSSVRVSRRQSPPRRGVSAVLFFIAFSLCRDHPPDASARADSRDHAIQQPGPSVAGLWAVVGHAGRDSADVQDKAGVRKAYMLKAQRRIAPIRRKGGGKMGGLFILIGPFPFKAVIFITLRAQDAFLLVF